MRGLLTALALLAGLSACNTDGIERRADDPPMSQLRQEKADCEAKGGQFARGGLFRDLVCYETLPDAGQACRTGADCTGECLVEDEDTRSCQKATPLFGCYNYVEENGEIVGICAD